MSGDSFLHISNAELAIGLAYAKQKHSVELSAATLRSLANETGARMRTHREPFPIARTFVLRTHLPVVTETQQIRRDAYSSSIAKIFSGRRAKKSATTKDVTAFSTQAPIPIAENKKGQFGWGF